MVAPMISFTKLSICACLWRPIHSLALDDRSPPTGALLSRAVVWSPGRNKVFAALPCKRLRYGRWPLKHLLVLCDVVSDVGEAPFQGLRLSLARRLYVEPKRVLPAVFTRSPKVGALRHMDEKDL